MMQCLCVCVRRSYSVAHACQFEATLTGQISLHIKRFRPKRKKTFFPMLIYLLEIFHMLFALFRCRLCRMHYVAVCWFLCGVRMSRCWSVFGAAIIKCQRLIKLKMRNFLVWTSMCSSSSSSTTPSSSSSTFCPNGLHWCCVGIGVWTLDARLYYYRLDIFRVTITKLVLFHSIFSRFECGHFCARHRMQIALVNREYFFASKWLIFGRI